LHAVRTRLHQGIALRISTQHIGTESGPAIAYQRTETWPCRTRKHRASGRSLHPCVRRFLAISNRLYIGVNRILDIGRIRDGGSVIASARNRRERMSMEAESGNAHNDNQTQGRKHVDLQRVNIEIISNDGKSCFHANTRQAGIRFFSSRARFDAGTDVRP
jgi:hypothetical protein